MIYYIADMHFGHKNVLRFDNRPFADTDLMDEVLIHNWNERVTGEDIVYVLGDICLNDIKYYTYFIAPADIYDFDQMENQYLDILVQKDTKYKWKARLKVTPKNFIDSIADVSFG